MPAYEEWCIHHRVEPDTLWVITHDVCVGREYLQLAGRGSLAVCGELLPPGTIVKLSNDDGTSAPEFVDILGTWQGPQDVWLGRLVPLEPQEDA